jgi:hypothetical protein
MEKNQEVAEARSTEEIKAGFDPSTWDPSCKRS